MTPRLFETLGLRLLEGRDFTPQDSAERPRVVVVNEGLARDFWPDVSWAGARSGRRDPAGEPALSHSSAGSPDAYTAAAGFTLLVALGALLVPVLRALAAQPAREFRAE